MHLKLPLADKSSPSGVISHRSDQFLPKSNVTIWKKKFAMSNFQNIPFLALRGINAVLLRSDIS